MTRRPKEQRFFLREHTYGKPKRTRGEEIVRDSPVHGGREKREHDLRTDRITNAE